MEQVKRSYRSPRREAQAARTREAIVEVTRRLLAAGGLSDVTMDAIAAEAGVSVQTVYATYGSKAAILSALLDRLEAEALAARASGAHGSPYGTSTDPRRQLRDMVDFHRRLFERGAEVITVALGSTASDPDIAAHVAAGQQRRRAAQLPLVTAWHRAGVLRPGLGRKEAADVVWSLTSPDLFVLHVKGSGWTPSRYAKWLSATLERLLFTPAETADSRTR